MIICLYPSVSARPTLSRFSCRPSSRHVHRLLYSDIVGHRRVGDSFVPLLCGARCGGHNLVTISYDRIHYVSLCKNHVDIIIPELDWAERGDTLLLPSRGSSRFLFLSSYEGKNKPRYEAVTCVKSHDADGCAATSSQIATSDVPLCRHRLEQQKRWYEVRHIGRNNVREAQSSTMRMKYTVIMWSSQVSVSTPQMLSIVSRSPV